MSRIFLSPPHQTGSELEMLQEVLTSNYLAPTGPMLDRLEAEMIQVADLPYALAVSSGTAALQLAFRHLLDSRVRRDARPPVVIGCTLSFIASVAPAAQLGCEIWLVDAEPESWTLDPIQLQHALTEAGAAGREVCAVVPTDLYGQACDIGAIEALCRPLNIPVICDSAEALGVQRSNAAPRTQVFSFNGNKILTCGGGGVLLSEDGDLVAHARKLSMQAREPAVHYEHHELGYNFRLSNLNAAVAVAQLGSLRDRVRQKRAIHDGYVKRLGDLPGVSFMPEAAWNIPTHWLTVLVLDPVQSGTDPETVRRGLEEENIESRPVWKPLHQQPVFSGVPFFGTGCADELYRNGLCLPSGTALTDADLDRIAALVRQQIQS
jgi:dTDP-4-amino-4,6-dideoxygalactose transaminase